MLELQPNKLRAGECKAEASFTREVLHSYVIFYAVFAAGSVTKTRSSTAAKDRKKEMTLGRSLSCRSYSRSTAHPEGFSFTREELHIYVILYAVFAAGLSSYGRTTLNLPATDRATTLRSYMASP